MLRWIILAVLVVVLSAAATVAVQFLPSGEAKSGSPVSYATVPEGPAPVAVVKEPLGYDFGTMSQLSKGSKAWTIRNEGEADLTLRIKSTTCKCTVANLGADGKAVVAPGKETEIRLEWETKELEGKFAQSATIATNDPVHEEIQLNITGTVQPPIVMVPAEPSVYLANLPNDAGGLANKAIFSLDRPDFAITSVTPSRPDLIDWAIKPLTTPDLKNFKVTAGHHLEIKVKPSEALGPFSEELILTTDHPNRPELRIAVTGKLIGPINPTPEEVRMPGVSGQSGGSTTLLLLVRGQENTTFTVEKKPDALKVEVAPADQQPRGGVDAAHTLRKYRMTVTVPPGTDPGVIEGPIVLKTDHPRAARVTIPARVLVNGAG